MPDTTYGTSGNDILAGGSGVDTIYGGDGDDIISGGNGVDTLFGDAGNDQLTGDNGADHMTGGADDDVLNGALGFDTAYYSGAIGEYSFFASAGYLHILHLGGAGADGHDQVKNVERLVFADRVINIGSGANAPIAADDHVFIDEDVGTHASGAASVLDNDFDFDGDALTVTGGTFTGTYGTLTLNADGTYSYAPLVSAQQLAQGENVTDNFDYTVSDNDGSDTGTLTFNIAGVNDAPTANADSATTEENAAVLIDVLANDTDVDNGSVLTLTAASAPAGQGSAAVLGNQVEFDPGSDFEELAVGESEEVVVSYDIADEHGAISSSTITVAVTGTNDGPIANPDSAATSENAAILIDVLANDTDVDNGAVLTVTAASAPAGQGTASVVGNQVEFDPGTDFDDLAVGESEEVVVSYDMADEHGAASSSTITLTVTGTNDGPVANPDTATGDEDSPVLIDVLANDTDADNGAILAVVAASAPAGQGTATISEDQVLFDPGTDFDYLAEGETAVVVISYDIADEHGATSSSTVTITVEGRDEGPPAIPTEGDDTLIGTSGDDTIDALGGDDAVFGRNGADLIFGREGNDQLFGEAGNDTVEGGNGDDFASGGGDDDQLFGQAGNDSLTGDGGDDQLSGGDGFDQLDGGVGSDVLNAGNDDDFLSGGEGNDQISGDAGNDSLAGDSGDDLLSGGEGDDSVDGGEGDDTLDGGGGNDILFDLVGTNSFVGGLGVDLIVAGSSDGIQTVDSGEGNDTIRVHNRSIASTITTGSGSDTIALINADVGAAAIVVTDFTAGAGGDKVQLLGDDGALLTLLEGWDGSSNPFGTGFLRLTQSGTGTLLEWDQDGATGGANWETLAVFENTDVGDFTGANFEPAYDPDGSALEGETITGTAGDDTLTGTVGNDTINALGGDDFVSGGSGADTINGGDGLDFLNGDAGLDVIEGGNDDDFLSGGAGSDQLSGQADNDNVVGDSGDDQLSGGEGDDSLDGGEGDDALDGGDGGDFLTDFIGTNSFTGGLGEDQISAGSSDGIQTIDSGEGNDTIRVHNRNFASTITTGSGSDTIALINANVGAAAIVVTDFTAGAGGDKVQLSGDDAALLSLLEGWDGTSNPFAAGFLRLTQSGADTLLEWDQDGATGGANWETLAVFENTDVGDFTGASFEPAYDPDGSAPAGETITGTAGDDTLTGTIGNDTINALGGDDTVKAGAGADTINGSDGFDFLRGEAGDDVIEGGNDDDVLLGGEGDDQLSGQAGRDTQFGDDGVDNLSGGEGDDSLDGGNGNDTLAGGDGDDFLNGSVGADVLSGGIGADAFYVGFVSDGPDNVTDFVSGTDKIHVSANGFGGGLLRDGMVSLVSGSDPTASEATGQFLFDTDDGRLFWDADGTGSGEAVLVATFSDLTSLTTSDFIVSF